VTPEAVAWLREQVLARRGIAQRANPGPWTTRNLGRHDMSSIVEAPAGAVSYRGLPAGPAIGNFESSRGAADAAHAAANDPQDVIARCEAELGILDLHGIWKDDTGIAAEVAADAVRHLAGGYRHSDGWAQHWGSEVRA
jgi:Family of unknown function (DUF6221)